MNLELELAKLENSQLVRRLTELDPAFLFKHGLVQETAYSSLLKNDRRQLHRTVGQALESLYPEQLDQNAALLARHFAEAGDDARTFAYARRAGDAAAAQYANIEALEFYSLALEVYRRKAIQADGADLKHLYSGRGRVLEVSGKYDSALQNYQEMQAVALERSDRNMELAALIGQTTVRATPNASFDPVEGQRLAEQALALARELGDRPMEAKILWTLLLLNGYVGHPLVAVEYGEQSLELSRAFNLKEQLAYTLNDISIYGYADIGPFSRAREALAEAHPLWQELGNLPMLSDNLNQSSFLDYLAGKYDQAVQEAEESKRISIAISNPWGLAFSDAAVANVLLERGEYGASRDTFENAIRVGTEKGFAGVQGIGGMFLALVYAQVGALERGLEIATNAFTKIEELLPIFRQAGLATVAYLHVLRGNLDLAEPLLQEARAKRETPLPLVYLSQIFVEGEYGLAKKEYAEMRAALQRFIDIQRAKGMQTGVPDALCFQARAFAAESQPEAARDLLMQALEEADEIGSLRARLPILIALAEIEPARGEDNEAQKFRRAAGEMIHGIEAHLPEDLRSSFMNLPQVQGIVQDG